MADMRQGRIDRIRVSCGADGCTDDTPCASCRDILGDANQQLAGPDAVCWEHQAGELPIRLSWSIKVF